jgi:hypothetical protein
MENMIKERWYPLKIFFPSKILILHRKDEKYTITWHNFACGFTPSAYHFFNHVLKEWYPLGIRLLIRSKLEIYEEEGINKSRQEFIEFEKFLKQKIQEKEKKIWKNILNQYIKYFPDSQTELFCLDKLNFKVQLSTKTKEKITKQLKDYLLSFVRDKIKSHFFPVTLFSFSKQMDALLGYMRFRLSQGESQSGFGIKEDDFLSWWIKNEGLAPKQLFPPFEKKYMFLELLLVLDFIGIIRLTAISLFKWKSSKGKELLVIDMFWGSFDIISDLKGKNALSCQGEFESQIIMERTHKGEPSLSIKEDRNYLYLKLGSDSAKFQKNYNGTSSKYKLIKCLAGNNFVPKKWSDLYREVFQEQFVPDIEVGKKKLKETIIKEASRNINTSLLKGKIKITEEKIGKGGFLIDAYAIKVVN